MAIVKVLVDAVGEYNAGDIVTDAPAGLVEIAKKQIRNVASGELLAVIVESDELVGNPTERELALQVALDESFKREEELLEIIKDLQAENDLRELKSTAKELKVPGYTKMNVDELRAAIESAGGAASGE